MEPVRGPAAALIVLLSAAAFAQDYAPPQEGAPGQHREEAFRMVDAYIVSNLQESLGLTDEQFSRLLPLVRRLHQGRRQLVQRRLQNLRELRRLLASGRATEAQVEQRLREAKRLENEEPLLLRQDREAVDATLSPLQQAKFRVLEAEVEQKIRGLRRRQFDRPSPRGRRGGAAEQPRPLP
jgi:Spy/CpxP family protein refolding chaperone